MGIERVQDVLAKEVSSNAVEVTAKGFEIKKR